MGVTREQLSIECCLQIGMFVFYCNLNVYTNVYLKHHIITSLYSWETCLYVLPADYKLLT